MSESKTHLKLKELAKKILLHSGFRKEHIHEEYRLQTPTEQLFVVDIAGVKKDKTIFIECGRVVDHNKLSVLEQHCDKMIWLPYLPGSKVGPVLGSKLNIYELVEALERKRGIKT